MKNKFKKWNNVFWLEYNQISNWTIEAFKEITIDNVLDKENPRIIVYWVEKNLIKTPNIYDEAFDFIEEKELYFSETELKNNL